MINTYDAQELFIAVQERRLWYMHTLINKRIDSYRKKHPGASQKDLQQKTLLKYKKGWTRRVNDISSL